MQIENITAEVVDIIRKLGVKVLTTDFICTSEPYGEGAALLGVSHVPSGWTASIIVNCQDWAAPDFSERLLNPLGAMLAEELK
jgi:hypothetical protein